MEAHGLVRSYSIHIDILLVDIPIGESKARKSILVGTYGSDIE
jgi:hypothetical protein